MKNQIHSISYLSVAKGKKMNLCPLLEITTETQPKRKDWWNEKSVSKELGKRKISSAEFVQKVKIEFLDQTSSLKNVFIILRKIWNLYAKNSFVYIGLKNMDHNWRYAKLDSYSLACIFLIAEIAKSKPYSNRLGVRKKKP